MTNERNPLISDHVEHALYTPRSFSSMELYGNLKKAKEILSEGRTRRRGNGKWLFILCILGMGSYGLVLFGSFFAIFVYGGNRKTRAIGEYKKTHLFNSPSLCEDRFPLDLSPSVIYEDLDCSRKDVILDKVCEAAFESICKNQEVERGSAITFGSAILVGICLYYLFKKIKWETPRSIFNVEQNRHLDETIKLLNLRTDLDPYEHLLPQIESKLLALERQGLGFYRSPTMQLPESKLQIQVAPQAP